MSSSSDPPPPQSQGVLYPAASSSGGGGGGGVGRPFILPKFFRHHPPPEQLVTLANPNPPRPRPSPDPPMPFQPRPPLLQPPSLPTASRLLPAIPSARPLPNSKAAPFPSPSSEFNGLRELNRDDTVVTVQDRKVRFSDGTSLYSLCRSWVRNGLPKETQTNIGNGVKLLPRPLPTATDTGTPEKSESGNEDGDKDNEEMQLYLPIAGVGFFIKMKALLNICLLMSCYRGI
ncbi:hypothetical protein Syun_002114 [Stephania yunnanensis]|uniref:Uncharacterized protein n=1 Tax=Stephania yunnanensis TaxID=152371 RepID=A0AAP0Q8H2_9MAGN